jgi:seryl-tRNA synthetase
MTRGGLTALTAPETRLLRVLDGVFEGWGADVGADPMIMPVLLPVSDLARLDFYENFPHQAMLAAPLNLEKRNEGRVDGMMAFAPSALEPAQLGLPSAACFAVYLHFEGQRLQRDVRVTVLGNCFRREEKYEGLRRLLGFHMREIVALGSSDHVTAHLADFGGRIGTFLDALGLPFSKEAATDPFYDRGGQRALLQRLSPVKQEFIVDGLAIASLNIHRNFFGERCDIRSADSGASVYTGCVAFGLERWLSVLERRFGDWETAASKVEKAALENFPKGFAR